jgi:hypothetical protein
LEENYSRKNAEAILINPGHLIRWKELGKRRMLALASVGHKPLVIYGVSFMGFSTRPALK